MAKYQVEVHKKDLKIAKFVIHAEDASQALHDASVRCNEACSHHSLFKDGGYTYEYNVKEMSNDSPAK